MESVLGVSGNQVFLYPPATSPSWSANTTRRSAQPEIRVDHARVIADCFQHSTVLPFRFGTVFNDDDSLRKSIAPTSDSSRPHRQAARQDEMHLKIQVDDCCGTLPANICLPMEQAGNISPPARKRRRQRERQTAHARQLSDAPALHASG